ncbi:MAG TPA: hypothetical protein VHS78_06895 [Candidatus Elarobacter sp.]|jgi:hypothetical protein|nr:hypothetical protein [Candidatus Elarobacter sp.]
MFWAALSHRVYYRTLPSHVLYQLFGEEGVQGPFALRTIFRKIYSIVAFTVIGFVVDKALPPARRRRLRAAVIVAIFSGFIEIAQKLDGAPEGLLSNGIDVACGALGGWLGAGLSRAFGRR